THAGADEAVAAIEADVKRLQAEADAPDATDAAKAAVEKRKLELAVKKQLPTWQNIDRLALVVTFIFFATLVWLAWKRREAEGQTLGAET
ncbi:MAG TPA: hypothetical protein PLV92_29940, partial [Pirellulaceae bacterium]|nr:hypothetical protein [Pirellulaceae bacterium]